jgi:hypothetical protein
VPASDAWTSTGSGRESERRGAGACGPTRQKKDKWAELGRTGNFSIFSNKFHTSLNCLDQKVDYQTPTIPYKIWLERV